jgi:hypothetical protein
LARLYADENFPFPAVEALRRLGHDVLTAQEAHQAGLGVSDEDVLNFAHSISRAVLTHNRKHFRNLHQLGNNHSGIVTCTENPDFVELAGCINVALAAIHDLSGQLVRITRPAR